MEEFIKHVMAMNEPKLLFILCGIFIFTDVLTGYLKAFKTKKINSSISRDGYLKNWTTEFQKHAKSGGKYDAEIDGCIGPKTLSAL